MADNDTSQAYESRAEAFKDAKSTALYWLNALDLAKKDEKDWLDSGRVAVDLYEGKKRPAFNILHSNTETIRAAAFNSMPVPDIRPRFNDRNETARKGGTLLERGLSYGLDEYDFNETLRGVVQDGILPGRGQVFVVYDPLMRTVQEEGPDGSPISREVVAWQTVKCERVPWDKYRQGPADSYSKVPWVARLKAFSRDELLALPGISPVVAKDIPLDMTDGDLGEEKAASEKSVFKKAATWEVWDRESRKVFYVCPSYPKGPAAVVDDPLGLLDFLPCPRPIVAIKRSDGMCPVTPYDIYRKQAEELNTVSERILALVELCKYRGIRASEIPELEDVVSADDGDFIPSKGALAVLAQGKSLDDSIWLWPLDKIIITVRELIAQRAEIKQAIFELTGIADIMRGASSPTETLGAQQLKAQWGSLRVTELQIDIQRFIRDVFRLKCEVMAGKYSDRTWALLNGGEVDPAVLQHIRNDVLRAYTIDIETDSTIRGDLQRSQQNMSLFLQGTAQFAQSIGPLIATPNNPAGVIPPDAALTVYAAFARQFKLGKEVEDKLGQYIDQAANGGLPQNDPKAEAEQEEAKQISKASAVADVRQKTAQAEKTEAEVEGQNIENMRQMVTPIEQPMPGFVQ